jgi:hypothetical protein
MVRKKVAGSERERRYPDRLLRPHTVAWDCATDGPRRLCPRGADDYIAKPYDIPELRARVDVGRRMVEVQGQLVDRVRELRAALDHVKTLQGILPICMHCHKIRNDSNSWDRIEKYIEEHSKAEFSHGLCPECLEKHYPKPPEERGDTSSQ